MILDFSIPEIMRLSSIERWSIIEMSRKQSVAEHSYNVAMISIAIVDLLDHDIIINSNGILYWALVHDLPELMTGDIPTPAKNYIDLKRLEKEICPAYDEMRKAIDDTLIRDIVKVADYVEAIQFAEKFCVDSRKNEIIDDIRKNMHDFLSKESNVFIAKVIERLGF